MLHKTEKALRSHALIVCFLCLMCCSGNINVKKFLRFLVLIRNAFLSFFFISSTFPIYKNCWQYNANNPKKNISKRSGSQTPSRVSRVRGIFSGHMIFRHTAIISRTLIYRDNEKNSMWHLDASATRFFNRFFFWISVEYRWHELTVQQIALLLLFLNVLCLNLVLITHFVNVD